MTNPNSVPWDGDVARVSGEIANRLQSKGITVFDSDTPDDVERLMEAVEEFEDAVEKAGGDLMVDEPPAGSAAQPDDPRFLLPKRSDDESIASYVERLNTAAKAAQETPPIW